MQSHPAPFQHLLVPLDGSHLAESALPAAAGLARALGSRVTLIHIVEAPPPEAVHGEPHLRDAASAEKYLANVAKSAFPSDINVDWHVHAEGLKTVAQGLADHAVELGAELVVMCSHGRGGFTMWIVGSIAQRMIGLGRTPVLLIPPAAIPQAPAIACRKLLVPLDGDPAHEAGLDWSAAMADHCEAALELLVVVPTLSTLTGEDAATGLLLPGATSAVLDFAEEGAAAYLDRQLGPLRERGLEAEGRVVRGDPAATILEAAEASASDIVVLATHGKSGFKAFWAGSVAAKVASRSTRPLLLIRIDAQMPAA